MLDAAYYLRLVSTWISQVIFKCYSFFEEIGFLNMIVAFLFASVVFRLIVLPLIGGRSFDLGMDKAKNSKRSSEE